MPIFVYEREDGTVFEEILKYKDRDITVCPTTGQQCTRVEFPGANFHLKGGGWENSAETCWLGRRLVIQRSGRWGEDWT